MISSESLYKNCVLVGCKARKKKIVDVDAKNIFASKTSKNENFR